MERSDVQRRALELFEKALDLDAASCARFLDDACADDATLRAEVEALLELDRGATDVLDRAGIEVLISEAEGVPIGAMIGPYRIDRLLGQGGFGVVYAAEQISPIRRDVAIKVIKVGMDSATVLARFDAERQALARLDHPFIARVFDAGRTEAQRPYFAMELVEGEPIDTFCRNSGSGGMDFAGRLRLFVDVCRAVHHAHQKGIIHRDLKPSNILVAEVDGEPVPKIIDFGIAKAVAEPLTDATMTREGQFVGTPAYMSPEQAAGMNQQIDTRSDVYSLGAILYEILTDSPPLDLALNRVDSLEHLLRLVREVTPERPSTRVGLISRETGQSEPAAEVGDSRVGSETRTWARRLRGDLDSITLKALEKEPDRRYESAAALGEDIARHLRNEPVLAGPPGAGYRFSKFARRHRAFVTAAGVLAVALPAATAFSAWQAWRAWQAEAARAIEADVARTEAMISREQLKFITDDLFGAVDPERGGAEGVRVKDVLDGAVDSLGDRFDGLPRVKARILQMLGHTYSTLAEYDTAVQLLEEATDLSLTAGTDFHADSLEISAMLVSALVSANRGSEAAELSAPVLRSMERTFGPDDPRTLRMAMTHSRVLWQSDDLAGCIRQLEQTHARQVELLGAGHQDTLRTAVQLGDYYIHIGRLAEAQRLLVDTESAAAESLGDEHPVTMACRQSLCGLLETVGENQRAAVVIEQLHATRKRIYGPDHPLVHTHASQLGSVRFKSGHAAQECEQLMADALEGLERTLGAKADQTIVAMSRLGNFYRRIGRAEDALAKLERVMLIRRELGRPDDLNSLLADMTVGVMWRQFGDYEKSEQIHAATTEAMSRVLPERHVYYASALLAHANALAGLEQYERALEQLRRAEAATPEEFGEDHELRRSIAGMRQQLVPLVEAGETATEEAEDDGDDGS